jgi:hypothetical protein
MIKIYSLLAAIFLLTLLSSNAMAINSLPQVTVGEITPQPVEPGQDLTIKVRLFNSFTTPMDNVKLSFVLPNGFAFKSAQYDFESGITLCGLCSRENTYFFTIDASTVSGIYPLFFNAYNSNAEVAQQIDVEVNGEPNLVFTADATGLDVLAPDMQFSVQLDIQNIGTGTAHEIKLISNSDDFISIGDSIKTINRIAAKRSEETIFDFVVNNDLEAGSYNIPIKITYKDDLGSEFNTTQNIGVSVVNKAELNVQNIKIAPDAGGSTLTTGVPFTAVIRIENVGYGKAEFITAEVSCPFDGGQKAFLGQLKRDEDAAAVFNMVSNQAGTFTCSLVVDYKDDFGDHQLTEQFVMNIAGQSIVGAVVIIVIIIIIGFIFRKRLMKLFGIKI